MGIDRQPRRLLGAPGQPPTAAAARFGPEPGCIVPDRPRGRVQLVAARIRSTKTWASRANSSICSAIWEGYSAPGA
jgi:hypothetical protein